MSVSNSAGDPIEIPRITEEIDGENVKFVKFL